MAALNRSLTVLVHGLSKVGKSTLAVTAPPPRLYLDVESASRFLEPTGAIVPRLWDPLHEQIPPWDGTFDTVVVPTRSWSDVQQVYAWLLSGQHYFNSLIIDSVSELQARFIEATSGREQATQNQWGTIFREVGGLMRDIRDLTMHPVRPLECVALTAMTKDVGGKWSPYVAGQLATILPYLPDITGYLYVDYVGDAFDPNVPPVEIRRLLTRRTMQFEAGERVGGRVPATVDNPNLTEMMNMIFGPKPEG